MFLVRFAPADRARRRADSHALLRTGAATSAVWATATSAVRATTTERPATAVRATAATTAVCTAAICPGPLQQAQLPRNRRFVFRVGSVWRRHWGLVFERASRQRSGYVFDPADPLGLGGAGGRLC